MLIPNQYEGLLDYLKYLNGVLLKIYFLIWCFFM